MFEPIFTAVILGFLILGLIKEVSSPAFLMFGTTILFMLLEIIDTKQALSGFSNPAMLTVGALFVVAAGLERTNALYALSSRLFGSQSSLSTALGKVLGVAGISSVFLNNTTVVTVLTPALMNWTKFRNFAVSHFLMPVSFVTILGGLCSLIGTSTNLLVDGLMIDSGMSGMSMFEIAWVGVPLLLCGWGYLVVSSPKILQGKESIAAQIMDAEKNYICDVLVTEECRLIGQTIEEAGLRHLDGLFLSSIERQGNLIGAVSPRERLYAGDRLIFVGKVETLTQVQQIPGIVPAYQEYFTQAHQHSRLKMFEVVISYASPLVEQTLRDVHFRSRYNAAVLAVHRAGATLHSKLGDIIFQAGDVLLVEAEMSFYKQWRYSQDFFLVAEAEGVPEKPSRFAWWALGIVTVMVALATLTPLPMLHCAFLGAIAMVLSGCLTLSEAKESVFKEFNVLVLIASAFGIGHAIETSGLAKLIADALVAHIGEASPVIALGIILLVTALFTEVVTNNAAAAIMFPVGMASAQILQADPRPFAIAVAVAASFSFMTPFGYQTNLMVYGPGGYQMKDYLKLGIPLKIFCLLMSSLIIPLVWKMY